MKPIAKDQRKQPAKGEASSNTLDANLFPVLKLYTPDAGATWLCLASRFPWKVSDYAARARAIGCIRV